MTNGNNSFEYTYSASEQAEIKRIRESYVQPKEAKLDKMERLRRLDASVTKKGTAVSIALGIIGLIVMGSGMSLIMTDIGKHIGISYPVSMISGVAVGVIGMLLVALALPIYNRITKRERKRIAPEIIRLSDELLK